MEKKKITQKEWEYIDEYNYATKWGRKLCNYYLIKEENYGFHRKQTIKLPVYILFFIPFIVGQFFYCCWDGGIKDFELPDFTLGVQHFIDNSKANEIWNKNKKTLDKRNQK